MGDILAILGLAASGCVLVLLMTRLLAQMGLYAANPRPNVPAARLWGPEIPLQRAMLLRAALLGAVALCGWQYVGEEYRVYDYLMQFRENPRWMLMMGNFLASLAAGPCMHWHLKRQGHKTEANNALLALGLAPFMTLGMVSSTEGMVFLLLTLAYIASQRRHVMGPLLALAAQCLDIRAIVLLPVFFLMQRHMRWKLLLYLPMAALFAVQALRGGLEQYLRGPSLDAFTLLGYWVPAAICVLMAAALSAKDYSRYDNAQMKALLLCGGILPFLFGAPSLQFALPLALSLQRRRYPLLPLLLLCVVNALYIGFCYFYPEVARL